MVAYTRILNLFWLLDFFSQNISANIPSPPLPPPEHKDIRSELQLFFFPQFYGKILCFQHAY